MVVVRPQKIKVGPHVYTVYWSKKSWDKYLGKGADKKFAGKTQTLFNRIFINAWNMSLSNQQETMIHELLHACLSVTGWLDDEYGWPTTDRDLVEEHLIRLLAPSLMQLLQENPELRAWLNKEDDDGE